MSGGEDDVTDLSFCHEPTPLIGTSAKYRESRENVSGFFEIPYFLSATYLLMEINDLVMYPKG
jgi:hypothetical protein